MLCALGAALIRAGEVTVRVDSAIQDAAALRGLRARSFTIPRACSSASKQARGRRTTPTTSPSHGARRSGWTRCTPFTRSWSGRAQDRWRPPR